MPFRSNYDKYRRRGKYEWLFGLLALLVLPWFIGGRAFRTWGAWIFTHDNARWMWLRMAVGAVIGVICALSIMIPYHVRKRREAARRGRDQDFPSKHSRRRRL